MVPLELKTHQNFLSVCIVLLFEAASGADGSKGVTLLHFFLVYASVVSSVAFLVSLFHYENTPIQIYWKIHHQKKPWKFSDKNSDIFRISAQNIDCGYSLEPPRQGGSNEYPQSMFLSRNKKNNVYPVNPSFTI